MTEHSRHERHTCIPMAQLWRLKEWARLMIVSDSPELRATLIVMTERLCR